MNRIARGVIVSALNGQIDWILHVKQLRVFYLRWILSIVLIIRKEYGIVAPVPRFYLSLSLHCLTIIAVYFRQCQGLSLVSL